MMRHYAPLWLHGLKERLLGSTDGGSMPAVHVEEGQPSPAPVGSQIESNATAKPTFNWLTAAASVAGSGHVRRGRDSDDWYELQERDGLLLVVVADGMGSVPYGAIGARVAARAAMDLLLSSAADPQSTKQLHGIIRGAVGAAQEALERLANRLSLPERDFATTLICAVAHNTALAIGQVGDGGLVVRTADGQTTKLVSPHKGVYANETAALGIGEEVLVSKVLRATIQALAVFSDGLERIALDRDRPYLPFLEPVWQFVAERADEPDEELKAFLQSNRVQQATDDDCTLVVAKLAQEENKP